MLCQLLASEWEEVVRREERFGAFGEVLHRSCHGIGTHDFRATVAETLLDALIQALRFGLLESRFDLFVAKAFGEHSVVIRMSQFMKREVGHPLGFTLEVFDVREFDSLRHRGIAFVVAQPANARVILSTRLNAGVFGREPQRHLPQFDNSLRRHHSVDLLKLQRQQFHRSSGRGLLLV